MSIFKLIKNRGGIGRSLSRPETVQRLNPIIQRHNELMYAYDYVIRQHSDREVAGQLERLQSNSRADIGKLSETVLSNAGTPPSGTDIDPDEVSLGSESAEILDELSSLESSYSSLLKDELKLAHHMRTQAILGAVLENSNQRQAVIRDIKNKSSRQGAAQRNV